MEGEAGYVKEQNDDVDWIFSEACEKITETDSYKYDTDYQHVIRRVFITTYYQWKDGKLQEDKTKMAPPLVTYIDNETFKVIKNKTRIKKLEKVKHQ